MPTNNSERKTINVGLIVADTDEYIHIERLAENPVRADVNGLTGHTVNIEGEHSDVILHTVCTGIGKVNAAAGTAYIAPYCDILLNAGLSGGFGVFSKSELVLGTAFAEHDFDLTPIGYEPMCKERGAKPIIYADAAVSEDILKKFPFLKKGVFATGDSFICSDGQKERIKNLLDPVACDMESAAVASVARQFGIPFASVRAISDSADSDSPEIYTNFLKCDISDGWARLVLDWLKTL